jgi:hypothetical protein
MRCHLRKKTPLDSALMQKAAICARNGSDPKRSKARNTLESTSLTVTLQLA